MSIPSFAIRRPVFAWMLMSSLILFGGISFSRMGVSQLPDVDFPVVNVSASLQGAAPEVMETTVVDVLEGQLTSIEGVKTMTSNSRTGSASITLEFDINRNLDLALQDVQARVAQAQRRLPDGMDPPTVSKTNPDDQPILWIGLTSDTLSRRELMTYVNDEVKDQFTTVAGVGDIFLGGYVDPAMRIWVDSKKLSSYSLTVNDLASVIQAEHSEPPAGYLNQQPRELNIRTMGEARTAEEFRKLRINTRGGGPNFRPIPLGDVVEIEAGLSDIRRMTRVSGKQAIGLGIRKQRGSNAVAVAEGVIQKMEAVRKGLPKSIEMAVVFDTTGYIKEAVHELNFTLVIAALLTALVCWGFLGTWASTFNVLMSIPTSIVGTFIVLHFMGFTLNTFTLLGLSLAIGIVVDDAIMVLENIIRHREMGKSPRKAAIEGSNEIMFAALAATISIAAIFLPVAFMTGIIGKFLFQFGVTMTTAVLLSLVEAITLTPMRASQFGGSLERTTRLGRAFEHGMEAARTGYARLLGRALDHRWVVVGASLIFFAGSLLLQGRLNKEFLPSEDQSRFMVRMQTAVGSSLEFTDAKVKEAEKIMNEIPEVASFLANVGGFSGEVNTGMFFVSLKPKDQRERGQFEIMDDIRKRLGKIQGLRSSAQDIGGRGFSTGRGFPVEFAIQGPDWKVLGDSGEKIRAQMEKSGVFTDVDTDYRVGMPELQIIPDRAKAAARGVTVQQVASTINALIAGMPAGYYTEGSHRFEIIIKTKETPEPGKTRIDNLFVRNNRGELIALKDVVEIKEAKTLQSIARRDRSRALTIYSNVKTGYSQQKALEEAETIARENLPPGYRVVATGSSQTFRESFQSLLFALALGLIVAYMVLGSQFNSFADPVTVLMALPFSVSGAFIALWIMGKSLNLYSMIGLILLMGIVKKNSILLVDFTNQTRDGGEKDVRKALLHACPNRLRPILMTSFATIVGALPAAISFGPGSESREPMAIAVIGGVLVSTLLTLFVVPCIYTMLTSKKGRRNDEDEETEVAAAVAH